MGAFRHGPPHMRWRPGRPGKRRHQSSPPQRPEGIAWRKLAIGVVVSLLNAAGALLIAFILMRLLRLPLYAGYGAVTPLLALGNVVWAPRDRVFYVSMGGTITLWLVGTLALASAS